jgi:hypothetical protein
MIEKDFDIAFIADLALREKQIQQNYRPIIAVHKWFARRPGTLFRGLLLSEFLNKPLSETFYQSNNLKRIKIADPFMGGGTPLIEANRLGCDIVGSISGTHLNKPQQKENKMRGKFTGTCSLVLAAAFFFFAAVAAPAADEGTASGTLTIAGKTTSLLHAYARTQKGFFDKTKEDILIILSDVAIPEEALADQFLRHKMAAEGQLHGVEVVLDSEKQAVSGGLLHKAFAETQGYVSVSGMHQFQAKTFDAKMIEGKLSTRKPDEFMNKTFEYAATFSAPVWRRPPPTATGPAAAQTAPGKAALAFLKAAWSGDKSAIKKLLTVDAGKELDGPRGKEMLEMLKAITPNPDTAQIDTVDIKGNSAEVTFVEISKDSTVTSHFSLSLEDGQWKFGK